MRHRAIDPGKFGAKPDAPDSKMRDMMFSAPIPDAHRRLVEAVTPLLATRYDPKRVDYVGYVICSVEVTEAALALAKRRGSQQGSISWGWHPRSRLAGVLARRGLRKVADFLASDFEADDGSVLCIVATKDHHSVAQIAVDR